jgi:hypothetical protein
MSLSKAEEQSKNLKTENDYYMKQLEASRKEIDGLKAQAAMIDDAPVHQVSIISPEKLMTKPQPMSALHSH